jgi:carbon-monoxide dehydrogenase medium subunit
VKPARFEYVAPRSEDEALAVLAEHGDGAEVLAGAAANLSG